MATHAECEKCCSNTYPGAAATLEKVELACACAPMICAADGGADAGVDAGDGGGCTQWAAATPFRVSDHPPP